MAFSRTFKISLLLSALIHAGALATLDHEPVARTILSPPESLIAKKARPKVVRFELVDTPASAETPEPPKKSDLMSDKNTRAQDRFRSAEKLEDSPHMEGKNEDSKDTRPSAIVAKSPPPPRPEPKPEKIVKPAADKPSAKDAADRAPEKEKKEPLKPLEEIRISREPEKKEVVRLAKKAPVSVEPAAPAEPITPRVIMSSASARNAGADARITGELSFATTRHFFGEYLLGMKQAVETEWISRLVSQYTGLVRSEAVIDFKIQPDGSVTDLDISSTEGDSYFLLICVSSIQDARPFDEIPYDDIAGLPEEFIGKPLSIRFTFRYN